MSRLRDLLATQKILMNTIDQVTKRKFALEKRVRDVNAEIESIRTNKRHTRFRIYLKKHPLQCQHEPGNEYHCARDDCSGGHYNCKKCGARRISKLFDNVWVTDQESDVIWKAVGVP